MYSPHELYNTVVQRNNLGETTYIPDDSPVRPKHVVTFTQKHGLNGDSINDPSSCARDQLM
jgi:hypothetical protein